MDILVFVGGNYANIYIDSLPFGGVLFKLGLQIESKTGKKEWKGVRGGENQPLSVYPFVDIGKNLRQSHSRISQQLT